MLDIFYFLFLFFFFILALSIFLLLRLIIFWSNVSPKPFCYQPKYKNGYKPVNMPKYFQMYQTKCVKGSPISTMQFIANTSQQYQIASGGNCNSQHLIICFKQKQFAPLIRIHKIRCHIDMVSEIKLNALTIKTHPIKPYTTIFRSVIIERILCSFFFAELLAIYLTYFFSSIVFNILQIQFFAMQEQIQNMWKKPQIINKLAAIYKSFTRGKKSPSSFQSYYTIQFFSNANRAQLIQNQWKTLSKQLNNFQCNSWGNEQVSRDQVQKYLIVKGFSLVEAHFDKMRLQKNNNMSFDLSIFQLSDLMEGIEYGYLEIIEIVTNISNQMGKNIDQQTWKIKQMNYAILVDQRYPWLKNIIAKFGIPPKNNQYYQILSMQVTSCLRVFAHVKHFYQKRLENLKKDQLSLEIYDQYEKYIKIKENLYKRYQQIKSCKIKQIAEVKVENIPIEEQQKKKKRKNKNKQNKQAQQVKVDSKDNKSKDAKEDKVDQYKKVLQNKVAIIDQQEQSFSDLNNFLENMDIFDEERIECRIQEDYFELWKQKSSKYCKNERFLN